MPTGSETGISVLDIDKKRDGTRMGIPMGIHGWRSINTLSKKHTLSRRSLAGDITTSGTLMASLAVMGKLPLESILKLKAATSLQEVMATKLSTISPLLA